MKYFSSLELSKSGLPKEVYELEQEDMITSKDVFYISDIHRDRINPYTCLYHGIRFDDNLKKLESILREKKIVAGKHIKGYYNYSDNANKGEYVSVTAYSTDRLSGFEVFVKDNICLLISAECNAYLTKYIDFNTWEKIKDVKTKNLYSYMEGEFLVKDYIPFEFVKAIGVPYQYLISNKGKKYADDLLHKIEQLVKKYEVHLNIVDTNSYNKVIALNKNTKLKR